MRQRIIAVFVENRGTAACGYSEDKRTISESA
jgi:hypothetical protein